MALLTQEDAGWWRYALEFARRGLWPLAEIETHGPHMFPADRLWGEAVCATDERQEVEVLFDGPRNCRHYSEIRGLRMRAKDDESCRYPLLPAGETAPRVKRWIRYAVKRCKLKGGAPGRA